MSIVPERDRPSPVPEAAGAILGIGAGILQIVGTTLGWTRVDATDLTFLVPYLFSVQAPWEAAVVVITGTTTICLSLFRLLANTPARLVRVSLIVTGGVATAVLVRFLVGFGARARRYGEGFDALDIRFTVAEGALLVLAGCAVTFAGALVAGRREVRPPS